MGKSTVGAMMRTLSIPVHESDHAVHDLYKRKSPARAALAAAFPYYEFPQIYDRKTKDIKRKELGALVFKKPDLLEKLEAILHPMVQQSQQDFIRVNARKGVQIVALDIPLLFETGAEERVDYTITVSAPYFLQRERVLARPNMSEEKLQAILKTQMPDAEKCRRSDYVIKTGLGRAQTMRELKETLRDIHVCEGLIEDAIEKENTLESDPLQKI